MQHEQQIPPDDKRAQVIIIGLGPYAHSNHIIHLIAQQAEQAGFQVYIDKGQCFKPDESLNIGSVVPLVERAQLLEVHLGSNDPQYELVPIWTPKPYQQSFKTMPGSRQDRYSRPYSSKVFGKKPRINP